MNKQRMPLFPRQLQFWAFRPVATTIIRLDSTAWMPAEAATEGGVDSTHWMPAEGVAEAAEDSTPWMSAGEAAGGGGEWPQLIAARWAPEGGRGKGVEDRNEK